MSEASRAAGPGMLGGAAPATHSRGKLAVSSNVYGPLQHAEPTQVKLFKILRVWTNRTCLAKDTLVIDCTLNVA